MLRPAISQSRQVSNAVVDTVPAPTGGWNARDPLSDMDKRDAIICENTFPGTTDVSVRKGSQRYAYGVGRINTFSRASTGTYFDSSGLMKTAAIDVPRFGAAQLNNTVLNPPSLIVEAAGTNNVLWSRDLSNAVWVKTTMTCLRNQVGVDGGANTASSMLATAANATVLQALVMAAGAQLAVSVKRLIGVGALQYTLNNGANWNDITPSGTGWQRFFCAIGGLNPTIGFRIVNSGDSFAIDTIQAELIPISSYIPTTTVAVTRAADVVTYLSGASAAASPAPVESLIEYSYGGTRKFLAGCNKGLFDISVEGSAGAALAAGYISDRWQYVNQGTYACLYNGVDTPQLFNGSVISAAAITGIGTPSNLIAPCVYGGRIFAPEKSTLSVWYGAILAIQGAFTKLDFSGWFKLGGKIVACGTWSRDGGSGANEYIIFISNMGEVLVYNGDPATAATWAKVGLYRTAPPVGDKPLVKIAQDLVLITSNGFLPLSMVLPIDRTGDSKYAISDKIRNAVNNAYRSFPNLFGWEAHLYPKGNMCIFNIPSSEDISADQYVVNTITGAWCNFKGLAAITWALFMENIYFGAANGYVVKFDQNNYADDQLTTYDTSIGQTFAGISWDLKPAFNYFRRKNQEKHFKMVRPVIGASGKPIINLALNLDFEDKLPTANAITVGGSGSQWDVALWDVSLWDSGQQIRKSWVNSPGAGYCATLRMRGTTNGLNITFYATDYVYEPGGVL